MKSCGIFLLLAFTATHDFAQSAAFITVKETRFFKSGKPWFFMGANYWYGAQACLTAEGKKRVQQELDFLQQQGVTNVRVLAGSEGTGPIHGVKRVEPSLQPRLGEFDENILKGLDFLLVELGRRNMNAVLFLTNNWDWSGGFVQYLNWSGNLSDEVMKKKMTWDENRDITSQFYSCKSCVNAFENQVKKIVSRVNSISGIAYTNDAAIMAWELANEPRPMRPAAIPAYIAWANNMSTLIKSIDKNHLVTTGAEGEMGTENIDVFTQIHSLKNIDYATIHIWPKNWGWFSDTSISKSLNQLISNSNAYIEKHQNATKKIGKPLVIEEFGLPRNLQSFSPKSAVTLRDKYYQSVFDFVTKSYKSNDGIGGVNFWAYGGLGKPAENRIFWEPGDDLLGDPPQEEQGLNSVFNSDTSTWQLIKTTAGQLKQ